MEPQKLSSAESFFPTFFGCLYFHSKIINFRILQLFICIGRSRVSQQLAKMFAQNNRNILSKCLIFGTKRTLCVVLSIFSKDPVFKPVPKLQQEHTNCRLSPNLNFFLKLFRSIAFVAFKTASKVLQFCMRFPVFEVKG